MKWRLGAVFATYGYLLVVWYNSSLFFPAPTALRHFLWITCPTCMDAMRMGGRFWPGILLALAPANALIYGAIGVFFGFVILKFKHRTSR